ncbi:MAG: hypothetical protein AUI14_01375 [Actinobacteria bacterium 13_2_20CM_2_71_6]|nr:MAG: hypothetical protein AUI14_01375 [Actinobacteria bacterium 13_2_20CM_2_71_6]
MTERDEDEAETVPVDEAEPAFVLEPGVPYVAGWAKADHAARQLRAELAAWGLVERVPFLRAEVTVGGVGVVELGRVTPATARLLAALLASARTWVPPDPTQARITPPRAA